MLTNAVEAGSCEPFWANRVLNTIKAVEPLLKTLHRSTRTRLCRPAAAAAALLLLRVLHEWDVAHIVAKDEEAVGIMSVVLSPGSISCFPLTQYAAAAKTLHPVRLPQVVQAGFSQISGSNGSSGGPTREGPKPGLFAPHVRNLWVGGLVNHLSCSQKKCHMLCFFIVGGAIDERSVTHWVQNGAMAATEKFA